ncbi:hypothetical protein [Prauserella flavalba]|uniref:Uncharacterized protein n=1 Tax=Prauserella flavalba TaxID=1477506 RepID=A0A318L8L5_9PSEU|nr:hypothetical protein [Prauserella flavalba]PXY16862.1 hypothetical protein BA062_38180 [Prauserella flavalba]
MPVEALAAAWRGGSIGYPTEPFTAWSGFVRVREVSPEEALPAAAAWLRAGDAGWVVERLREGLDHTAREHLARVAVRVGWGAAARRCRPLAGPAASWCERRRQARPVGSRQYPLVTGDVATVARILRELAPTCQELLAALEVP